MKPAEERGGKAAASIVLDAEGSGVHPKDTFYSRYGKRCLDIIISFSALVATVPVNCVLAGLTLLDVGLPLFFFQQRIGKDHRPFTLVKFRNMSNQTDENGKLLPAPQRTSKYGNFVRNTSLDELLNFWSILKGDMSVIGPRPFPYSYLDKFSKRHAMRHAVRPGLECPNMRPLDHVRDYQEQFENDVWYVENLSFRVDCILLFRLIQLFFDRNERAVHAKADVKPFMGYDENGEALSAFHS